jgi:aminoglycoside phosphotransferase (APT) family kinase protein
MADAGTPRLAAALAAAGIGWDRVAGSRRMSGGTFNGVHLVELADGASLVVKLPPGPDTPLLRYERGILGTEAEFYRLAGQCDGVDVPALVAVGEDDQAGGYLLMTRCPGRPWPELSPAPVGAARDRLRFALGGQVARLHAITGPGFGYPSGAVGPLRETWRAAFLDMVSAVLEDARTYAVTLPRPIVEVEGWFADRAHVLDAVTRPSLVHFDLWDGNILVSPGPDGPEGLEGPEGLRIGALIDAERSFWGDPLGDFVSTALFGDIEDDPAFVAGYRAAGGSVTFDDATRLRILLYKTYLNLIMWVEAVPRQVSAERVEWLRGKVLRPLTSALGSR